MEITKREIIASISILAILLILGLVISERINEYELDQKKQFSQALKIKDKEIFTYAMKTSTGNAFVEGEMKAVEPVTYEDLEDTYMYVEKVTERYTMHTRTVTYTDSNGKKRTKTETYWTWDTIARDSKVSDKVTFLGVTFNFSQFDMPSSTYIDTISAGYNLRNKYYAIPKTFKATIFSKLKDGNIEETNVPVYEGQNIQEVTDYLINNNANQTLFWCVWVVICCAVVYAFVYEENTWLNRD